jgi:predicted nucleotidyltransferase/biotin operon repressor
MAKAEKARNDILKTLFKDFLAEHTITSLSSKINITRMGIWKALKTLEKNNIIILTSIGIGKTSTYSIKLNWENPLLEKTISIILLEEALNNQKWISNFTELRDKVNFLILFGSILTNPKEAGDIDLIAVLDNKNNFKQVDKIILAIQITQTKKIHMIDLTKEEFKEELKKQNKAYFDALKKGVILFGQDNFIKFIRSLKE